jgi:pre-mRNA-splicing factor ATP-dependent RNA helicase DHX16
LIDGNYNVFSGPKALPQMSNLRSWVAAQLLDPAIVGSAEASMADYCIATAAKAATAGELLRKLNDAEVPVNDKTKRFAVELFNRVPRPSAGNKASAPSQGATTAKPKSNADVLKQSARYSLVMDDEDGAAAAAAAAAGTRGSAPAPAASSSSRPREREREPSQSTLRDDSRTVGSSSSGLSKQQLESKDRDRDPDRSRERDKDKERDRKRHVRRRTSAGSDSEEEEEEAAAPVSKRAREEKAAEDDEFAGLDPEEAARLRDQKEKEEFEARLLRKDESRTKKLTGADFGRSDRDRDKDGDRKGGGSVPAAGEEHETGRKREEDEAAAVPALRILSRREYLAKREEKELALLREEIRYDEQLLAGGTKFTGTPARRLSRAAHHLPMLRLT